MNNLAGALLMEFQEICNILLIGNLINIKTQILSFFVLLKNRIQIFLHNAYLSKGAISLSFYKVALEDGEDTPFHVHYPLGFLGYETQFVNIAILE